MNSSEILICRGTSKNKPIASVSPLHNLDSNHSRQDYRSAKKRAGCVSQPALFKRTVNTKMDAYFLVPASGGAAVGQVQRLFCMF
jgi:hypothetical protein